MKTPRLAKIAGTALILAGTVLGFPQASALDIYPYRSLKIDCNLDQVKVQTVPEYIRNVPIHPNDGGGKNVPIKDSGLSYLLFDDTLEGKIGIGIREGRFDFKIGPELGLAVESSDSHSSIIERNYTNAPGTSLRGYGAALTFYQLVQDDFIILSPGISARASYCIVPRKLYETEKSIFVEYSASFLHRTFNFETGWDRWDSFETYKKYEMSADIVNHTIKAGFEINQYDNVYLDVFAGITIPQIIKRSSLADEAGLTLSPGVYIGLEFGFKGDNLFSK